MLHTKAAMILSSARFALHYWWDEDSALMWSTRPCAAWPLPTCPPWFPTSLFLSLHVGHTALLSAFHTCHAPSHPEMFPQDAPPLLCEFCVSVSFQDKGHFWYRFSQPHVSLSLLALTSQLQFHICLYNHLSLSCHQSKLSEGRSLLTIYPQNPIQTLYMVYVQKVFLTNLINNE